MRLLRLSSIEPLRIKPSFHYVFLSWPRYFWWIQVCWKCSALETACGAPLASAPRWQCSGKVESGGPTSCANLNLRLYLFAGYHPTSSSTSIHEPMSYCQRSRQTQNRSDPGWCQLVEPLVEKAIQSWWRSSGGLDSMPCLCSPHHCSSYFHGCTSWGSSRPAPISRCWSTWWRFLRL